MLFERGRRRQAKAEGRRLKALAGRDVFGAVPIESDDLDEEQALDAGASFRGGGHPVGRDSVEPSNERSEASHASITRGIDQGSTESHPTGVSSLSRWERRSGPARALPVKLSRPFTPQFGGNSG